MTKSKKENVEENPLKTDYQKRQEKLLERATKQNDPFTFEKIKTRLDAIPDAVRV